jgi:hypothetical protein
MSDQYCICIGDESWQIAHIQADAVQIETCTVDETMDDAQRVEQAKTRMIARGYHEQPVAIALPSSWCLCAVIDISDLGRSGRRRAMGFRLEEHLPISVEDIVADYLEVDDDTALGVCSDLSRLQRLVDAFEQGGMPVGHLCPAALLAAAQAGEDSDQLHGAILASNDKDGATASVDFVELRKGQPTNWWWFADDITALRDRLKVWAEAHDQTRRLAVAGAGVPEEGISADAEHIEVHRLDAQANELAARRTAKVAMELAPPSAELRQGALAPPTQRAAYQKPVGTALSGLCLLIITVLGLTQWRGLQYQSVASQYEHRQYKIAEKSLQGEPPQRGIKGRMISTRRRLAGLGGQASSMQSKAALRSDSALVHLTRVVDQLPSENRYHLSQMRIGPDSIRIDGGARSYVKAEAFAVALRETGWYKVSSPETDRVRDGVVRFNFTADPMKSGSRAKSQGKTR